MELFNRPGLMEVNVSYRADVPADTMIRLIKERMIERHGREISPSSRRNRRWRS